MRDDIKCERVVYNASNTLEYVGIKNNRPPSADDTFYDQLTEVFKLCSLNKELLLMGEKTKDDHREIPTRTTRPDYDCKMLLYTNCSDIY